VQPKINLQSFKSTPESLKQHLTALERKRSLGALDAFCGSVAEHLL